MGTDPRSARAEAERLVATALAMAQLAARGQRLGAGAAGGLGLLRDLLGGTGPVATGDPACCVCPVCRAITALRDPSPELADRLAAGAGDFAAGVASLLRALAPERPADSAGQSERPADPAAPPEPAAGSPAADPAGPPPDRHDPPTGRMTSDDEVWRQATWTMDDSDSAGDRDVWSAATNAPVDVAGTGAPPAQGRSGGPAVTAPATPGADAAGAEPDRSGATRPDHGRPGPDPA
ncbi:hypothetical protein [Solwaraspora sp. WMMD792]|uniref:hypothetical protein n=1 Tax=Solwaraspora sp. WMMD792 TaxID=3016099 RepID=UPI002415A26E|nr:hypothetical protein [Solwaraspora sp. WMMD792]MDG4772066.1 hypothetical protein [Solwaraspora sp. WMMD792]